MSGSGTPTSVADLVDKVKTALAAGHLGSAEQDLYRIVETAPDWLPGRLRLSALLSGLGKHEDARLILEPAVGTHADNGVLMSTYGLTLFNLGRVDRALRALQQAIVAAPDNPVMVYNLIRTMCRTSLAPHAYAMFNWVLKMAPAHPDILQSASAFARPRTEDRHILWGEEFALKAVLLSPDKVDNLTIFIWFMARLRRTDKAGILSRWLTAVRPRGFQDYGSMAFAMFTLQQPHSAAHYARAALVLDAGGGDAWFLYARILHASGEVARAADILRIASCTSPDMAENAKVMNWTLSLQDFTKTFARFESERKHED